MTRNGRIYGSKTGEASAKAKSKGQISGKAIVTEDIPTDVQKLTKEKETVEFLKFIKHSEYSIVV